MAKAWDRELNVLFLCTGNSARSILAEAIMSREGLGRFKAFSAGSQPKGAVHPVAIDVLRNLNYDVGKFRSKPWEEFSGPDAPQLDFVFTVCDNAASEVCPIWPGQPMTAHWGIPDPAAVDGNDAVVHAAFFDTYRMLFNRISLFTALPFTGLDALSLQKRLDTIGKNQGRGGPAKTSDAAKVMDVVIYHNPDCGTSRNVLAMIRDVGIEPHVVEYLKSPPARALLVQLAGRAGLTPRGLLREKGTPYADLGLADPDLADDALVDTMMTHPILINRPLVVSPLGVRLCRPSETVLGILPTTLARNFVKEYGEVVAASAPQ